MKIPVGNISGLALDELFQEAIRYHIGHYYDKIAGYESSQLYSNWRKLVRSIDEIINIPLELDDKNEKQLFLSLNFNFINPANTSQLEKVLELLTRRFDEQVANRFKELAMMCFAIDSAYNSNGIFAQQGNNLRLYDTRNAIIYLQSRRAYYVSTLHLISRISKGKKMIGYKDTLNELQYHMDSCMINNTTAYYNLLLNHCLTDFEMTSDGLTAVPNFIYHHLEGFFLEPERLSMLDQMELRPELINMGPLLQKADKKIFSFSEVSNTMDLFEATFNKYHVQHLPVFRELNILFPKIAVFLVNDFDIIIDVDSFDAIATDHPALRLYLDSGDYYAAINNYAPFQKKDGSYFSTVVLLTRFVYRTLSQGLLKNRSFQINSGFVFEDKTSKMLQTKGFKPTHIKRINHKEFDLITTKNGKVFNFQCKNNYIDISRVGHDYRKIGRFNKRLCGYYEKALIKEQQREDLIKEKTGIDDITHFVVSRYPVITRNEKIINFSSLTQWNAN